MFLDVSSKNVLVVNNPQKDHRVLGQIYHLLEMGYLGPLVTILPWGTHGASTGNSRGGVLPAFRGRDHRFTDEARRCLQKKGVGKMNEISVQ